MSAPEDVFVARTIRGAPTEDLAVTILRGLLVAREDQAAGRARTALLGGLVDQALDIEREAQQTDDEAARSRLLTRARAIRDAAARAGGGT